MTIILTGATEPIETGRTQSPAAPACCRSRSGSAQDVHQSQLPRAADHPQTALIAIVDDEPVNIQVVKKHLHAAGYQHFAVTTEPSEAMALVEHQRPDVLLLDVMMPGISGLDILRQIRANTATEHVPVLILTAASGSDVKRTALESGATDFLAKPVDPNDLIPRVRNALQIKSYWDQLAAKKRRLSEEVRQRTAELAASRTEVVHCLARAAEYRDDDTGRHVQRVGKYVGILARQLGFDEPAVELLELAAQLHDLGKVAVPDAILHKPGKLTVEEFGQMQKHCVVAKTILRPISGVRAGGLRDDALPLGELQEPLRSPLLELATRIAQTHHEKWDGTGYPLGLAGEDIPIEGRMTAVADVFDALASRRCYKPTFPHERCFRILEEGRGKHFDPKVIAAFFARRKEILDVQSPLEDQPG